MSGAAKLAVAETYDSQGQFMTTNGSYGLPAAASITATYVSAIDAAVANAANGVVTIYYKEISPGKVDSGDTITLTPDVTNPGATAWVCASPDIDERYLPANCR